MDKERIVRIAIMGQAAFGAKVLETLSDRGEEIIAAWLPQGKTGGRSDPLKTAAGSRGIPAHQPKSYKAPETFDAFWSTQPDLLIMAFVTDIIPLSFVTVPTQGAIGYHPSILPRHRGGSAINWALIMGDQETGLSIFWTDAGIDTGPVLPPEANSHRAGGHGRFPLLQPALSPRRRSNRGVRRSDPGGTGAPSGPGRKPCHLRTAL
jgi:methionyl-tRNA formyltransferase